MAKTRTRSALSAARRANITDAAHLRNMLLLDLRCRAEYVCNQIQWARKFFWKHEDVDKATMEKVDALLSEARQKATEAHVLLGRIR